jgi:hypothetical protein
MTWIRCDFNWNYTKFRVHVAEGGWRWSHPTDIARPTVRLHEVSARELAIAALTWPGPAK